MKEKNINKFNAFLVALSYFLLSSIFNNYIVTIITFLFQIIIIFRNKNFISKNKLETKSALKSNSLLILVLFFMFSIILAIFGGNLETKFGTTLLVFGQIILIYLGIKSTKDKNDFFQYLCKYFIKITVIFSVYAIVLYIFGNRFQTYNSSLQTYVQSFNFFGINFFQTSLGGDIPGTYNVGSLFSNPNTLSYTCLIAMIMSLLFLVYNKKTKILFFDLILIVSLIISGSRLAIVLSLAIIPIYLFTRIVGKNSLNKVLLISIVLLVIIGIVYNAKDILSGINFNGRLELWTVGVKNIGLFGRGLNSDNLLIKEVLNLSSSMHNSYISFGLNFGILLLIVFLGYIVSIINKCIKKSKENIVAKILLVLLFVFLIFSLSEYTFFSCGSYNLLFFIILYLAEENLDNKENTIITL